MIVSYETMKNEFQRILMKKGYDAEEAEEIAEIFTQNSVDGVYSHGVNRFPRAISYIEKGYIHVDERAVPQSRMGAFERWDGRLAMGNLNAKRAMARAVELAHTHGIGIVAIGNTNHWMRGGYYGWQAANAGCIGICWTNTMPNMPAWGAVDHRIGNNPFIIAVPRADGRHAVIDCAMAQYSYGKIEESRMQGRMLPFDGGYDSQGRLTRDPAEIEKTGRVLPIGYWKGSGLSITLDLVAAVLSQGNSTTAIGKKYESEYGLSQVLIAIDPGADNEIASNRIIDEVLTDVKASRPAREGMEIFYPGEIEFRTRQQNMKNGIPVMDDIWNAILAM